MSKINVIKKLNRRLSALLHKSLLSSGVPRTATEREAWEPFKLMGGLFAFKSQKAFAGWGFNIQKSLANHKGNVL
jgi:hypothetical protein